MAVAASNQYQPIRFLGYLLSMYALAGWMFLLLTRPAPVAIHMQPQDYAIHTEPKPGIRPRPAVQGLPAHVVIPSIGINLPVKEGAYDPTTAAWSIDHSAAYHANVSMPVNESNGTTLIYAHAQSGLFDTLSKLSVGAQAVINSDNGHTFTYTYDSMRRTDPTDTSVFTSIGPPTLVLQTCSGDWSQYRDLYSFRLTGVS
jgi:LPXTG-site transpeptidase (sortase) family protein